MKDNKQSIKPVMFSGKDSELVEFGMGRICCANSPHESGEQYVFMGDTMEDRKVGVYHDEPKWSWEDDIKGRSVVLRFDDVESINVLIHTLQIAKNRLHNRTLDKPQPTKVPSSGQDFG